MKCYGCNEPLLRADENYCPTCYYSVEQDAYNRGRAVGRAEGRQEAFKEAANRARTRASGVPFYLHTEDLSEWTNGTIAGAIATARGLLLEDAEYFEGQARAGSPRGRIVTDDIGSPSPTLYVLFSAQEVLDWLDVCAGRDGP